MAGGLGADRGHEFCPSATLEQQNLRTKSAQAGVWQKDATHRVHSFNELVTEEQGTSSRPSTVNLESFPQHEA